MHLKIVQIVKQSFFKILEAFLLKFSCKQLYPLIQTVLKQKTRNLSPSDALVFLFTLENKIIRLADKEAVRYGNGVHTKHRHIKYHDFFIEHIEPGSRVLDVGCGNGAVDYDIATKVPEVNIFGVDLNPVNIEYANKQFTIDNIRFICGDALRDLPEESFDVIILSNVLEHLKFRVQFLRQLQQKYQPRKFLIRVPMFERDWQIPLQAELGVDYRLDKTHYIEYRQQEFLQEITEAGLQICHSQVNWGEIWAEVVSS